MKLTPCAIISVEAQSYPGTLLTRSAELSRRSNLRGSPEVESGEKSEPVNNEMLLVL